MPEVMSSFLANWLLYLLPAVFVVITILVAAKYMQQLRRSFELIVAVLSCVLVFALDVGHVFKEPSRWVPTVLAVALVTMIALNLGMRQILESLADQVRPLVNRLPSTFSSWDARKGEFRAALGTAQTLSVLAMAPCKLVRENFYEIRAMLTHDAKVQLVFLDPTGTALKVVSQGRSDIPGALEDFCQDDLPRLIKDLPKKARANLEVRTIDLIPACIISLLDAEDPQGGIIYATLSGARHNYRDGPSFCIKSYQDSAFLFLKGEFEALWMRGSKFSITEVEAKA